MGNAMAQKKPVIAITMGDPAGVGPEVTVAALARPDIARLCAPLVVGDTSLLRRAARLVGRQIELRCVAACSEARFAPGVVDVLEPSATDLARLQAGTVSAVAGQAAVEYVMHAVDLARTGQVAAMVTGPINKEAIRLAGYSYIGHTEILNDLTKTARSTTMLVAGRLRVAHVTRHVPFSDVTGLVTRERVLDTIRVTAEGLRRLGITKPRLGVAALNPHGGEGGLIGGEELAEIAPAVEDARADGIQAVGPLPADSIFFRAIAGEFDAVVAMYHDQGHIAVKVHDFEGSYTVTLGLPFVRTSVDHGTAFDIAWKGVASERSMVEAIKAAIAMVTGQWQ